VTWLLVSCEKPRQTEKKLTFFSKICREAIAAYVTHATRGWPCQNRKTRDVRWIYMGGFSLLAPLAARILSVATTSLPIEIEDEGESWATS